jgi:hypothetical protein
MPRLRPAVTFPSPEVARNASMHEADGSLSPMGARGTGQLVVYRSTDAFTAPHQN